MKKTLLILWLILPLWILGSQAKAQEIIFSTKFGIQSAWTGAANAYDAKTYTEGGWYFHSTNAYLGVAAESFDGSAYSFRDRGIFTLKNLTPVDNVTGFSFQLRDWMLNAGKNRKIRVSFDGGSSWTDLQTINKAWFNAYQVYQEFVHIFPDGPKSFEAEKLHIQIDGGDATNDSRINIGYFAAFSGTVAPTVTIAPRGGLFFNPIQVEITSSVPAAQIYYTLDGSTPDANATLYTSAFELGEDAVVKAIAKDGDLVSQVVESSYLFRKEIVYEGFEGEDFGQWKALSLASNKDWFIGSAGGGARQTLKYAEINGFQQDAPSNDWLISPIINLNELEKVGIYFYTNWQFGNSADELKLKYSTDYQDGDPGLANWTELSFDKALAINTWASSGLIELTTADLNSNQITFALHYLAGSEPRRWRVDEIYITGVEDLGEGSASLKTFAVNNINVLNRNNLIVEDAQTDVGAVLFVEDFTNFKGINLETVWPQASISVKLNDNPLEMSDLAEQILVANDVLVVTVVSENLENTRYYKLTLKDEIRSLSILAPVADGNYFAGMTYKIQWESQNIENIRIDIFREGKLDDSTGPIVAALGELEITVANGDHGKFNLRISDASDLTFFKESGEFNVIDEMAPVVLILSPANQATAQNIKPNLSITFDEKIKKGTGNISLYKADDTKVLDIDVSGTAVTINEKTATIALSQNLEHETGYYILVGQGAFTDMQNNAFAGITNKADWTFTTKALIWICNGDFENWTDGKPDCWLGVRSNIAADAVKQYSTSAQSGTYAVQLINTEDIQAHKRFSSKVVFVENGQAYTITFWVRGQGKIRTGLYDGREAFSGYSAYNTTLTINSETWVRHSQQVTAANTSENAEFIFSVFETNADKDHLQLDNVSIVPFDASGNDVANIAALRAGVVGQTYKLTGEAVLTFKMSFRNQKFIQDATGAIMIDDQPGIITTNYLIGDGITGITGVLDEFNGMLRLQPTANPGAATSSNLPVVPLEITLNQMDQSHESRLVKVSNVSFANTSGNFFVGTNYVLNSAQGDGTFTTNFYDANYIGTAIPAGARNIVGIVYRNNAQYQLTARDLNDFSLYTSVSKPGISGIRIFPNPFTERLTIENADQLSSVEIISSTGQVVIRMEKPENQLRIETTNLKPGLYFIRLTGHDGRQQMEKLLRQ